MYYYCFDYGCMGPCCNVSEVKGREMFYYMKFYLSKCNLKIKKNFRCLKALCTWIKVLTKVLELAETGVGRLSEIRRQMKLYVEGLFVGRQLPPLSNNRY